MDPADILRELKNTLGIWSTFELVHAVTVIDDELMRREEEYDDHGLQGFQVDDDA